MTAACAGVTRISPGRQQKLKYAKCKLQACSKFTSFLLNALVKRQKRFMNERIVKLLRSTCDVHIERSSVGRATSIQVVPMQTPLPQREIALERRRLPP